MYSVTFLVVIQVFFACHHVTEGRHLTQTPTHHISSRMQLIQPDTNASNNPSEKSPARPAAFSSPIPVSTTKYSEDPQLNFDLLPSKQLNNENATYIRSVLSNNINNNSLPDVSYVLRTTSSENDVDQNENSILISNTGRSSRINSKRQATHTNRSRTKLNVNPVREIPDNPGDEKFMKIGESNLVDDETKFNHNDNEKFNGDEGHKPTANEFDLNETKTKPGDGSQVINSEHKSQSQHGSIFEETSSSTSLNDHLSSDNQKSDSPNHQRHMQKKHKSELAENGEGDTKEKLLPVPASDAEGKFPNQFSPSSILSMAVYNLQKPGYLHSRPGFGMFQGSDDRTRSASSSSSSDWWSQDAWSGSDDTGGTGSDSDVSMWFQKSAGQDSTQSNENSNSGKGTGSSDSSGDSPNAWLQSSSSVNTGNKQKNSDSSSSGTSSSSASSSGSASSSWTGSSGGSAKGSDSNLDSFSYDLWQSVLSSQGSSSSFSRSNSFGSGTGATGNGLTMSQQGGVSSSVGQAQGGGSATGFVQGGASSGMNSAFSFGMNAFGGTDSGGATSSGSGVVSNSGSTVATTTGGNTGFGFGSSMQGFGSSGGSGVSTNDNNLVNSNNNGMNSNTDMFNFGSSSGTDGFNMGGSAAGGSGLSLGGSGLTMGMNPGFGGSQGNTGDNAAGLFFKFAQAQNAPGAKTGAGFGSSQGMGSNIGGSSAKEGSTFPLQGAGSSSRGSSGFWASPQGKGDSMSSGAFQFNGGMSENNNAWQFSGMTNPGFSDPGFGGSQALGGGAGFGSSQGAAGGLQGFSGTPGFGSSQGGMGGTGFGGQQGGGGINGNSFSLTNGMSGGGVNTGVASGLMSTGLANGGAVGGATSNQGGSLSQVLGNLTRGVGLLSSLLDEEGATNDVKDNTGTVGSPFSLPQFLMGADTSNSNPFGGMSAFAGGPSAGNSGPSSSSGNLFTGGGAPISGFTIGGGGQVSSPASAAKFNFGSSNSDNQNPGSITSTGSGSSNSGGTSGFPGTGSPFSQPQNGGMPNGAPGAGGGGASAGSPFSGATTGGSAGSPFSSALTGESPFGSSSSSLFGTGSGGGSPFSGSGNSNPFTLSGTDSGNPFSSSMFQTGSADSSGSPLGQFMPQFNPNGGGSSQTSTNQQTSGAFSLFSLGNGALGNNNNNNVGNSGSAGFTGFQLDLNSNGNGMSSMFPMYQSGMSVRNAPNPSNMALSRLIASMGSISNNANNTALEIAEATDLQRRLGIDNTQSYQHQALQLSQSLFSGIIDDTFLENVMIRYCDDLIHSKKEKKHFTVSPKEDHNFYHKSKASKHHFTMENSKSLNTQNYLTDTLIYFCNSLVTQPQS